MPNGFSVAEIEGYVALLTLLSPLLVAGYKLLVAHLPANVRAGLERDVAVAVAAAEQVYSKVPGSTGAQKKLAAQAMLSAMGVKVSPTVDALIEAAVLALPAQKSSPSPVAPVVAAIAAEVAADAEAPSDMEHTA